MKVGMACTAKNQCFSSPGSHLFDPEGLFTPVVGFEIFECSDMMHLDFVCEMSSFTSVVVDH
jgi:arginine deiminase